MLKDIQDKIVVLYAKGMRTRDIQDLLQDMCGVELSRDLKAVYGASTLEEARAGCESLDQKWGKKYHHAIKFWRVNWGRLMLYFRYPVEIRKLMYTLNHGEGRVG